MPATSSRALLGPSCPRPDGALGLRLALTLVVLGGALGASRAHAQFDLPPDPHDRPPALIVEPRVTLGIPLATGRLCPSGSRCVYGPGFGIGALVERRYRSGVGLGIAYDVNFLDSNDVYEVGTLQTLSVSLRYFFLLEKSAHPFVAVQGGGSLFGDTFRVATGGFHVDVFGGVEIEATHALSFTMYTGLRALYTRTFRTPADDTRRSEGGGLDLSLFVGGGLALRFERD